MALTRLELGLGNYAAALAAADFVLDRTSFGWEAQLLPAAVEAAVRTGNPEAAAASLARLRQSAESTGTHWGMGMLGLSEALLPRDKDPEPLFLEALAHLEQTTVVTDLARAHLLYGEWLRRDGRRMDARTQLRTAHETFESMGARAFADRARSELRATGERARRRVLETVDDLTPQERHVADLAAQGSTNQDIASHLFISANTVDYHLRKVYRKLGIGSRRQLLKALTPMSQA